MTLASGSVAALVDLAAEFADAGSARGRALRDAVVRDGALSAPMADWAVRATMARYTPDAVARCAQSADLAGHCAAVLLAASVPTAPLRAIVLPWLRGASRIAARASRRQPAVAALMVEALAAVGAPVVALDESQELAVLARDAAVVIAYGSDVTLAAVRGALPEGVRFEGHGHGFGVAVVLRQAAGEDAALEAVARDIAHYDQRGCLSPQCVFVEGGDARGVAQRLSAALTRVQSELPRGPLDIGHAARVHQWQGALAATADAFYRGATHATAALGAATLAGSPGARNVAVVPLATLADLPAVLAAEAAHLTCVGVAGPAPRRATLPLPAGAVPRVVPAGEMQDPPLDGPEDPRAPLGR